MRVLEKSDKTNAETCVRRLDTIIFHCKIIHETFDKRFITLNN